MRTITDLFGRRFRHSLRPRPATRRPRTRLQLEKLEERTVPAIPGVIPGGTSPGGGGFPAPPPPPPSSVSGFVYCDDNDDGRFQRDVEEGLAGVTIQLMRVRTGVIVDTTITGPNGRYEFTNLRPGRYKIIEIQPPGVEDGKDTPGVVPGSPLLRGRRAGNDMLLVFLPPGRNGFRFNFGEHCDEGGSPGPAPIPGEISGRKFEDLDGDGTDDDGTDPGLKNVVIELYRDDGDGVLDAEDELIDSTKTKEDGTYSFSVTLDEGTYFVKEVVPTGYEQTFPDEPDYHVIVVPSGCEDLRFEDLDFGNAPEGSPGPVPPPEDDCPVPDEADASFSTLGTAIVNIIGSSSADAVVISQTSAQLVISFTNGETGITTTQTFALGTITKVNFFGQSGDDTLTVNNSGALLSLEVNYDGGLGTDTLHLRNGTALSETLIAGQAEDTGAINFTGSGGVQQTINYNDIGQIIDTVFAQNFTITANNKQQPIEILDGSTRDGFATTRVTGIHRDHKATLCHHTGSKKNPAVIITVGRPAVAAHVRNHGDEILSDEPATTPIEFANKTNVTINGSNGSDSFLLNHPTAGAGLQKLTIDGQNGKDTLNKVALAAAVELVLASIEQQ